MRWYALRGTDQMNASRARSRRRMANTGLAMNDCLIIALIHGLDPNVFAGKNRIRK